MEDKYRKPEWDLWTRLPKVSLLAAVALSLDIDPDSVTVRLGALTIRTVTGLRVLTVDVGSPVIEEFVERYRLGRASISETLEARNPIEIRLHHDEPEVRLREFVIWALDQNLWLPDELRSTIAEPQRLPSVSTTTRGGGRSLAHPKGTTTIEKSRPKRLSPPRLKPFWVAGERAICEWLDENGCPAKGDGNQALLERFTMEWLDERGHAASEGTVRAHVRNCIHQYRARLEVPD